SPGMGSPGLALPHRTDEESSPHPAHPPEIVAQLVAGQKADLQRRHRGPQQPFEIDAEKIVRFSYLPSSRNRFVSYPRRFARTHMHPQILLRSPNFEFPVSSFDLRFSGPNPELP